MKKKKKVTYFDFESRVRNKKGHSFRDERVKNLVKLFLAFVYTFGMRKN